jgi:hypothetical protein
LFTSSRAGKEKLDFGEGAVEIRSAENKAQVRFVAFAAWQKRHPDANVRRNL